MSLTPNSEQSAIGFACVDKTIPLSWLDVLEGGDNHELCYHGNYRVAPSHCCVISVRSGAGWCPVWSGLCLCVLTRWEVGGRKNLLLLQSGPRQ